MKRILSAFGGGGEEGVKLPLTRPTEYSAKPMKSSKYKDEVNDVRNGKVVPPNGPTIFTYYNTAGLADLLPTQILGNASYSKAMESAYRSKPWYQRLVNESINGEAGSMCDPRKAVALRLPQMMVHTQLVHIAKIIENNPNTYKTLVPRGMLVMHSTGAGKTRVQSGLISAFHDLVMHHNWKIYMVTTKKNASANNLAEFADGMYLYPHFLGFSKEEAEKYLEGTMRMRDAVADSPNHRANWVTYDKMYNARNSPEFTDQNSRFVIVLDEVHSPLMNNPKDPNAVNIPKKFVDEILPKFGDRAFVVMLTATPGTDTKSLLKIMSLTEWKDSPNLKEKAYDLDNFVDAKTQKVKNLEKFQLLTMNKVSFVDMNGLKTLFPKLITKVERIFIPKTHQAVKYKEFLKDDMKKKTGEGKQFMASSRKASHAYTYPLAFNDGECSIRKGYEGKELTEYSATVPRLLKIIEKHLALKQKIFIYTRYEAVSRMFQCAISKHFKFALFKENTSFDRKTANADTSKVREIINKIEKSGAPQIMTVRQIGLPATVENNISMRLKLFNDPVNNSGKILPILIGADDDMQGLDLKEVKILIQIGENESVAVNTQFNGRAVRPCSQGSDPNNQQVIKYKIILGNGTSESRDDSSSADFENEKLDLAEKIKEFDSKMKMLIFAGNYLLAINEQKGKIVDKLLFAYSKLDLELDQPAETGVIIRNTLEALKDEIKTLEQAEHKLDRDRANLVGDYYFALSAADIADQLELFLQKIAYMKEELHSLIAPTSKLTEPTVADIENVDLFVRKYAIGKYETLEFFYRALRQSAFDCSLLIDINRTSDINRTLQCGVKDIDEGLVQRELASLHSVI